MWVGRYRIVRRLGAGGMATVYLANDKRGRTVAVKVLHEHLRDDPVFRGRFAQEVTAARRVASFCTARVLDAHVRGPTPFLVTEYVDGMSLHDWVTDRGPLSAASTEALAVGVAAALTAIHAVGLVHRDLKPGNVMLSPLGPKVIDFGIAGAADHITTGIRFGTPGWLAPEQLAGQPGTPATDVYAWGLLIAWAASGQLPTATTTPDVSRVPQWLQPLVRAALSVDPARRPSARQLLLSLCGSDRPAKVQAATTPITWPLRQPGAAPPPALPPKGSDHLAAAYAKAGRRTRPLPLPTLVATRVEQAKGRFCLVDLSVTNAGKHTGWVFMGSQRLVDAAGKEYSADDWAWAYYPGSRRFTSTIEPGATAEGTLVFDVPEQVRLTKLIVHDTPLSDGTSVSLR